MLELIFLFIVLPKRMTRLARERDCSALVWTIYAIVGWIGAEFIGAFISIVFGMGMSGGSIGWNQNAAWMLPIIYLFSFLSGMIGAELVTRSLKAKPVVVATHNMLKTY